MSTSANLFHKVNGGLVGAEHWTAPLEGAYTRIAKLAILNALDTRSLSELLFNKPIVQASYAPVHSRTLLASTWAAPGGAGTGLRWALDGFLDQQCGRWATHIASDQRLRLCRRCADVGFQTALFQIDAITDCPIHQEPLIDFCPHCGTATPPYALTSASFDAPMQCTQCGRGYGLAWTGAAEFERWGGPSGTHALIEIGQRLEEMKHADIEWSLAGSWVADPTLERPVQGRKRLVFDALQTICKEDQRDQNDGRLGRAAILPGSPQTRVSTWPCRTAGERRRGILDLERDRTAIYKSICRRLVRKLRLRPLLHRFDLHRCFHVHSASQAIVPTSIRCSPALHALAVWTLRFERSGWHPLYRWSQSRDKRGHGVRLQMRMVRWPIDREVDDNAWGHFVWSSFKEDLWTAQEWARLTMPLDDPFEHPRESGAGLELRRAEYIEHLRIWTPRLSSRIQAWSSGFTYFIRRRARDREVLSFATVQRTGELCDETL